MFTKRSLQSREVSALAKRKSGLLRLPWSGATSAFTSKAIDHHFDFCRFCLHAPGMFLQILFACSRNSEPPKSEFYRECPHFRLCSEGEWQVQNQVDEEKFQTFWFVSVCNLRRRGKIRGPLPGRAGRAPPRPPPGPAPTGI